MDLEKWAEKEIEIACKKENPDRTEGEWDYGCACYESALKAFKSLPIVENLSHITESKLLYIK